MKKKQFMSKMAALAMAAMMGVAALPATVMAAPVTGLAVSEQAGADAAATSGLVQTTLPTELTDETGTPSQTLLATLKKVYENYDATVETDVEKLDADAAIPTDVTSKIVLSSDKTIPDTDEAANSIKYNVALDSAKNITVTPATGNTTATAGSAVIPVIIKFTDSVPTASVSTATLDNEVALNLNVKWGTDVQDVLADAVKNTKLEAEKTDGELTNFAVTRSVVNPTTGALDASMIKDVVSAYNTGLLNTTPEKLLVNTSTKGYGVKLDYVSATDYVAPTSTTEGGYNLTLKVTVTGKGADVPTDVTKSENVTCHITIGKTAKVIVNSVGVASDATTTGSVWTAGNDGTIYSGADKTATVGKAGKAYPIDVAVNYTSAGISVAANTAGNKKSEVTAAGVTISLKGDSSVAHLVDSATANTGKAIVFDKIGSVEIQYTTPNFTNLATSDTTDVTSKTDTLATVDLKDNAQSFQSVLDSLDKTVTSGEVASADDIEAAVKAKVQAAYDTYYGRATTLDISVTDAHNFIAAVAGSAEDTDGTNGSFYATVKVRNTTNTLGAFDTNSQWTITPSEYVGKFSDIKESDYFATPVYWGVENDIVQGTTDTTFSPKADVTRAQFVTFLYRQAGSPDVEINKTFSDISGLSTEFQKAVSWAAAKEITNGVTDTTFAPNATVTREQAVTFLFRYANGKATTKVASFKDVDATEYYADAVNWGAENGVVEGYSADTFGVGRNTNRGEAITFIYRALAD